MSQEQILPAENRDRQTRQLPRWVGLLIAITSMLLGLIGIGASLVMPQESWSWDLRRAETVTSATVNAVQRGANASGLSLARQGRRPVSVITPPLNLSSRVGPVAIVRLGARPSTTQRYPTRVRLLWQMEEAPEFHPVEEMAMLSEVPCEVSFALPFPASRMHRIGVQLPDYEDEVLISSIEFPSLSIGRRLQLFGDQLFRREPIVNRSLNYFTGPRILGHGLNYFLVCLLLLSCGGVATIRLLRRRSVTFRSLVAFCLILWLMADAHATLNLWEQTLADVAMFRERDGTNQIATMNGREIAWAYSQLTQHAVPGDTFAVISDDTFTPAHRLAYLLAPQRTRGPDYQIANFIVVINASTAHWDESKEQFRVGDGKNVTVELVAELSPYVYLLRSRVSR